MYSDDASLELLPYFAEVTLKMRIVYRDGCRKFQRHPLIQALFNTGDNAMDAHEAAHNCAYLSP